MQQHRSNIRQAAKRQHGARKSYQHSTQQSGDRSRLRQSKSAPSTICVVGLGYVGLPLALLLEARGNRVIGIDIDRRKVDALHKHIAPYLSEDEQEQFRQSSMDIDVNPARIREADVVIICVPTPVGEDYQPDLGPLQQASMAVGTHLKRGALVIVESTVNPGACEEHVLPILVRHSGLVPEEEFYFAHCPERINPGDPTWTVSTIPRVVGANSPQSLARAKAVYESALDADVYPMASIREAEAVKMIENTFRDINIAFVNELAMSFEKLGIDVVNVIRAASTKPFAFMPHFPGCGVGGHCIPVDPYYLMEYAARHGFEHKLIRTAREINNDMPRYTVDLLEKELGNKGLRLFDSRIALLGLSYKANIPDTRESPALRIYDELAERGALVQAYDPYNNPDDIPAAGSLDEALAGAHAIILATGHDEFVALEPERMQEHGINIIIDGRNCLQKEAYLAAGLTYRGIGR